MLDEVSFYTDFIRGIQKNRPTKKRPIKLSIMY